LIIELVKYNTFRVMLLTLTLYVLTNSSKTYLVSTKLVIYVNLN